MIADEIIAIIIHGFLKHKEIAIIGVIFCQVDRIKQFIHLSPLITLGNQKWKGAAPIFMRREIFKIIKVRLFIHGYIFSIIIKNNKLIEVRVWIKKYLIMASDINILKFSTINGINDIKLISNPIQIPNQEWEVTEIKVLEINRDDKNILL